MLELLMTLRTTELQKLLKAINDSVAKISLR